MTQQIMVIHGGTTFEKYDEYISFLKTKQVTIDRLLNRPGWKQSLQSMLGSNYQVLLPTMPNTTNANYNEWATWFTNISQLLEDGCIVVGHSLGGIFLAKYLSENVLRQKIKATILIAAPFNDITTEDLTNFKIETLTPAFENQAGKLIFFNGPDDLAVSIKEADRYRQFVPDAEFNIIPAPDHFVRETFPELVERIISL